MNMFHGLLATASYCPFSCIVTEEIYIDFCCMLFKSFLPIIVRSFKEMHILQNQN